MLLRHALKVTVKKSSRKLFAEIVNRLFLDICPVFTFNSSQFNRKNILLIPVGLLPTECVNLARNESFPLVEFRTCFEVRFPSFQSHAEIKNECVRTFIYATFLTCLESKIITTVIIPVRCG